MGEPEVMWVLQWAGFVCLVIGTWYYTVQPVCGALYTIIGCLALLLFAVNLDPPAYGLASVQAVVAVLSLRNIYLWTK